MVSLPVEIVHLILEWTGDGPWLSLSSRDRRTLSSCSRVCRAWKDPAQSLLYRMVVLDSDQRYDLFRDFLASTPRIAAYIHYFGIERSYYDTYPLPPFLLLEILELLPHIDTVELDSITTLGWPTLFVPYPEEGPFRLRRLVVRGTEHGPYFNRHCMRFDFLRLFAVDELACYGNADSDELTHTMKVNRRGVPNPRVRRLEIVGRDCYLDFNEKSGGGLDPDALETLDIETEDEAGVKYAGRFLKRYARSIRHVVLDVCYLAKRKPRKPSSSVRAWSSNQCADMRVLALADLWKAYNIDACVRLETLTFHLSPEDSWTDNAEEYAKAYGAVLESTTRTLRELTLITWYTEKVEELEEVAPHISQLITQAMARFKRLEKVVRMVQRRFITFEEYKAALSNYLPADTVDGNLLQFKDAGAPKVLQKMKHQPL